MTFMYNSFFFHLATFTNSCMLSVCLLCCHAAKRHCYLTIKLLGCGSLLEICQVAKRKKNYWMDFHEICHRDWSCLRIDHIKFWLLSTSRAGFFNTGRYGAITFWISFINRNPYSTHIAFWILTLTLGWKYFCTTINILDSILEFPDHGLFQKKLYEVPVLQSPRAERALSRAANNSITPLYS